MSSVITTRMLGRPSLAASAGRASARSTRAPPPNPPASASPTTAASARDAVRRPTTVASILATPSVDLLARTYRLCHTLSTHGTELDPLTAASRQTRARKSREEGRERISAAATELVRRHSYAELSIGEIMDRAGFGRTIFYRHFDDLGDLLLRASREAMEEMYEAQLALAAARVDADPDAIRAAIEPAVAVYDRHGPLLRAVAEAAPGDERVAAGQEAMHRRFDELVAQALAEVARARGGPPADVTETARALNLLNVSYLLDAFGREPRVSVETAVRTLTEIWVAVFDH
ncbi:MAG: TetR family transcriptional regulator [Solirubrobacterales bacterium]|nr:TetR family transcriptional regulator [Solirubrobacterales bacterium]